MEIPSTRLALTSDIIIKPFDTKINYKLLSEWTFRGFIYTVEPKIMDVVGWVRVKALDKGKIVTAEQASLLSKLSYDEEDGTFVVRRVVELHLSPAQMRMYRGMTTDRPQVVATCPTKPTPPFIFCSKNTWLYLYNRFMPFYDKAALTYETADGLPYIIPFLLPLMAIPNMAEDLERYIENPDNLNIDYMDYVDDDLEITVYTEDQPEYEGFYRWMAFLKDIEVRFLGLTMGQSTKDRAFTTREHQLTVAFMHSFAIIKQGVEDNVRIAMERRVGAFVAACGYRHINHIEIVKNHCGKSLYNMCTTLSKYPRLKAVIFSNILSQENVMSRYMRNILADTQVTVFAMIVTFISARPLTLLHAINDVMNEYQGFMNVYKELKSIYGINGWRYAKLINPEETLTIITSFPYLANAGRAYVSVTSNNEALRHLYGVDKVSPFYFQAALTPLVGLRPGDYGTIEEVKSKIRIISNDEDSIALLTDEVIKQASDSAREIVLRDRCAVFKPQ